MINLTAYCKRIGLPYNEGEKLPMNYETLRAIHRAQVMNIPFEDLALHEMTNFKKCGKHLKKDVIKLDEASLFNKLVTNKRGGYCHENNELLALVLLQLGFNVKRLLGRVVYPTGIELPKGHKLLLVTINDKKYIADVGYGGNGLLEPISLDDLNKEIKQGNDTFKLIYQDDNYILQVQINEKFVSQYEFSLQGYKPIDYLAINKYLSSTSSNTIFVRQRMCIKPTEYGRLILIDDLLKIRTAEGTESFNIEEDLYLTLLKEEFDIVLEKDTKLKAITSKSQSVSNDNVYAKEAGKNITLFSKEANTTSVVIQEEPPRVVNG